MKRLISFLTVVVMATMTFAQSAIELAEQQQQLRRTQMRTLNMKPSKSAKREARALKKQGWMVVAGAIDMEHQITNSQLYGEELMADEEGNATKRYIIHTAFSTAGTYNVAFAAARANGLAEVASMIKTQLVSAWRTKLDNRQSGQVSATTVEQFNQRIGGIVDQSVTNATPVVTLYRRLRNNNFEVQVRMMFDKRELTARLKRNLEEQLEDEGDELNEMVDEMMENYL